MSSWLDKAKEAAKDAAQKATVGAKKLADTAKNADYGSMYNKTKDAAMHAADEAKKAAGNIMHKDAPTTAEIVTPQDNPQAAQTPAPTQALTPTPTPTPTQTTTPTPTATVTPMPTQATSVPTQPVATQNVSLALAKLEQAERLLHEVKSLLK